MKISQICWVSFRKHIPYQEIKLIKATQGLSALEAKLNFRTRRLHSQGCRMLGLLFWGDSQWKGQIYRVRLAAPSPQRDKEKGQGTPASPAPYTSLSLGPACVSGFPGGLQGGCSSRAQQFALLCWQPTRKCRDLAVLGDCSWALLSQRIRAVRKSCQRAANPYNY